MVQVLPSVYDEIHGETKNPGRIIGSKNDHMVAIFI